jgi:hypothetical protein
MTGVPATTLYHRWLGWHAPALRRAVTVLIAGLTVAVVLLPFMTWGLALAGGLERRRAQLPADRLADHYPSRQLTRAAARRSRGPDRRLRPVLLIGAAVLTVVLSWAVSFFPGRTPARYTAWPGWPGGRSPTDGS